jgi:hypothetical protein
MKKILRTILIIFLVLIVAVFAIAAYVKTALPNVGASPDIKIPITPERVERGKYLANHVSVCMDCHSLRDWNFYAGPIAEGTFGGGGILTEARPRTWLMVAFNNDWSIELPASSFASR